MENIPKAIYLNIGNDITDVQDFNALDMSMTVRDSLHEVSNEITDQEVFRTAAQFLLTSDMLKNPIGSLSE